MAVCVLRMETTDAFFCLTFGWSFFILFIYSEMLLNSVVEVKVKILKIIEMMQRAALLS